MTGVSSHSSGRRRSGSPAAASTGRDARAERVTDPTSESVLSPGSASPAAGGDDFEHFEAFELACVLSRYDLGAIESIRIYRRGSRRAPKLHLFTEYGEFLLKRRAPGRDDPFRVAFAHGLQLHLAAHGFPLAHLIGTRTDNNSLVQFEDRTYELFQFVHGSHPASDPENARQAGVVLGAMHRLSDSYVPEYDPPRGSYHASGNAATLIGAIPAAVARQEPGLEVAELERQATLLNRAYDEAASRVERYGAATWPRVVIHGDFHRGNILMENRSVVAVLDFDSARIEPRMIDVANAGLQFSMDHANPADLDRWPETLDLAVIASLIRGVQSSSTRLSNEELKALPWLMMEALIIEAASPLANTGTFGRLPGSAFLRMVERKLRWLRSVAARFPKMLAEA